MMQEEVIRQRDIELEGKNERIRNLLIETDALRARLSKSDAAAAAAARRVHEATVVAAGAAVVAVLLLLLLLLLVWAGMPLADAHWLPSAAHVAGAEEDQRVVGGWPGLARL